MFFAKGVELKGAEEYYPEEGDLFMVNIMVYSYS